ncbi:MAG: hypothetical protein WCO03_02865 [bacterium]
MDIFTEVKKLNLPLGSYVVMGSGPMSAHGLKEAHDIDIVVNDELFEQLKNSSWTESVEASGSPVLRKDNCEIYKDWDFSFCSNYNPDREELITNAEIINGIPFAPLLEIKRWKEAFGRDKDMIDIKLIDEYLDQQK